MVERVGPHRVREDEPGPTWALLGEPRVLMRARPPYFGAGAYFAIGKNGWPGDCGHSHDSAEVALECLYERLGNVV